MSIEVEGGAHEDVQGTVLNFPEPDQPEQLPSDARRVVAEEGQRIRVQPHGRLVRPGRRQLCGGGGGGGDGESLERRLQLRFPVVKRW